MWGIGHFRRMWSEAMPEDRAVAIFFAGWIGLLLIVGLWAG